MKKSLILLLVLSVGAIPAMAQTGQEKPDYPPIPTVLRAPCGLQYIEHDWDFANSPHGFMPIVCDASGGLPVWAWGASTIAGAPGNVWGTVLAGNYPNNAGEGLISPQFFVTPDSDYMEILHYVHMESNFDGGNVSVGGTVILPTNGYTHTISTSTSYYAYCVDMEPGYSGNGYSGPAQVWLQQCFDLTAYTGQEIQVEFDFGADSSVAYPGWYLAYVKIGSLEPPVGNDEGTWGQLKSLYR